MSKPLIPPDKELGKRIRLLREKKNMSQTDLAEAIGLESYQMISLYECGKKGVSEQNIKKIARALDVGFYTLIETEQYLETIDNIETEIQKELLKEEMERLSQWEEFFHPLGFDFFYDRKVETELAFWDLTDHSKAEEQNNNHPVGTGPYHIWNDTIDVFLSESEVDILQKTMKSILFDMLKLESESQKRMNLLWQ